MMEEVVKVEAVKNVAAAMDRVVLDSVVMGRQVMNAA